MREKLVRGLQAVPFWGHLIINLLVRLALIKYGDFMDAHSEVPYTDIDYRVVTDGAMHMQNNSSPYLRHTYRYSPLLAWSVLPNLTLHPSFGKVLFACFDLVIGVLIKAIVCNELKRTCVSGKKECLTRINLKHKGQKNVILDQDLTINAATVRKYENIGENSALIWLYNPLTMVIGTRGNGDAMSSCMVLFSLYFLQHPRQGVLNALVAGICHGLAIHLRLYPIFFSLAYFLVLADRPLNLSGMYNFLKVVVRPNRKQIALVLGTLSTLCAVTGYFYQRYGYEFLYETYIYHLERKDTRHNFSFFFYLQYLTSSETATAASFTGLPLLDKLLIGAPSLAILLYLTFSFGTHFKTLPFCLFAQTFVMVAYNSVVTSQYFIWFLSLLPLCLKNLKRFGGRSALAYTVLWFLIQGGWLLPAYLLEFKGWNTFDLIWIQSLMMFSGNVFILQRLIRKFEVVCDFNAMFVANKNK